MDRAHGCFDSKLSGELQHPKRDQRACVPQHFLSGFRNSSLLKNFMGIKPGRNYRGKKIKPEKTEQERKATYYQYS